MAASATVGRDQEDGDRDDPHTGPERVDSRPTTFWGMTDAKIANPDEVNRLFWFHTIDLGHGVVTPGTPPNEVMERAGSFPDVRGKSVLDIGAWDGKYSFRAEQAGARQVVALDHYVWQIDWTARSQYIAECQRAGVFPDPELVDHGFLQEDKTPGRSSFDYAREILGSNVEPVVANFSTCDLDTLGTFDVVLYLGVLYHMVDPLTSLHRLRKVTNEVAVIETEAVRVLGHGKSSLMVFYAGNELGNDYGNWYAPTELALHEMCRSVGFSRIETKVGPPPLWKNVRERWQHQRVASTAERYRLVVHAYV